MAHAPDDDSLLVTRPRLTALRGAVDEPLAGPIGAPEEPVRVLVVDDESLNRRLLGRHLERGGLQAVEAADGAEGLARLYELGGRVDVIVLDLLMPQMGGEEMLEQMRRVDRFARIPVLVCSNLASIESQESMLELGASDYLNKPVRPRELLARVRALARLKRGLEQLEDAERVILSLARAIEAKDEQTEGHCERLSLLSVQLGRSLGLGARELRALDYGGVLHDIGKVGIPDRVLFKPGPLSPEEWAVMRRHTTIGDEMVAPLRSLQDVRPIIRHHHERWNGSGYPDGLQQEQIPLVARVLQVVDAYDALRSERPYKTRLPHEEAVRILRDECGRGLWDPRLLEAALDLFSGLRLPSGIAW